MKKLFPFAIFLMFLLACSDSSSGTSSETTEDECTVAPNAPGCVIIDEDLAE